MGARLTLTGIATAAIVALGASPVQAAGPAGRGAETDTFTPVIQDVISTPRWFRGVDGRVHIDYDLRLLNSFPVDATITSIEVRRRGGGLLGTLTGDELLAAMSPLGRPAENSTTLPPATTALAYIGLTVPTKRQLPRRLVHTTSVEVAPGLPLPPTNVTTGARARVTSDPPIAIDPPLAGARWAAIVGPHRRALQPINGRLTNGQRYAIDWNRIDEQDRPQFGDPASFASNPSYGAPVLAVGDAKVVEAVDGIANQPPDSFTPVGIEIADGNFVILKLAPGVYAGYAHLIPGSVAVDAGDRVRSGQVLGELGNSGNSDGPHLHFQLMDRPSLLASDALPIEFRRFKLRGVVASLDVFGEAYFGQTPVPFTTAGAGPYRDRGPVGLDILDFPDLP